MLGRAPGTVEEQRQYASLVRTTVGQQYSVLVLSASPRRLTFATPLPVSETTAIFNDRVPELRADPVNGTVLVAQDIGRAVATTEPEPQATEDTGSGGDSGGGSILPLLVIAGVGAGGIFWLTRRGRKKAKKRLEDQRGLEKAMLDPLIDGLAAQINDLDPEIQVGGERAQAAKADYQDAVLTYSDARAAVERAQTPAQIAEARAMLEKGLRSARRARAHLDGRPVEEAEQEPLLEGLCTFDPKHGRAVGQATVTAPDGRTAEVPVCADCMRRMEMVRTPRSARSRSRAAAPVLAVRWRRWHGRPHERGAAGHPAGRHVRRRLGERRHRARPGRRVARPMVRRRRRRRRRLRRR